MRPLILIFLLTATCIIGVRAQSPYDLSTGTDLSLLGGGAVLFGIDIALGKKVPALGPQDTVGLNILKIPGIDRPVVRNWSTRAHHTSDIFLKSSPIIPLALPLLAGRSSRHKMGVTYLIVFEGMLLNYTVTELTKLLAKRKRPYVYGKSAFDGSPFTQNAQKSFFSGHSSVTAANYFLGAKMFSDFYPGSDWEPVVWTTAAVIPAITAWKRVQAGKHFITDVIVGYAVGALIGVLIPELHKL